MKKKLFFILFFISFLIYPQSENQKSIDLINNSSDSSGYATLLNSEKYSKLNENELRQLIIESEKQENRIIQIYTLNRLGIKYRRNYELDKAIKEHQKALILSERIKDIDCEVHTLNLLGICNRIKLNIKNALDYHQKVLKLADSVTPTRNILINKGIAQNNVGEIYRELKQNKLAIQQFEQAIKIQEKLENKKELAYNYISLGKAYENDSLYKEAKKNYETSLKYNTELDNNFGIVTANNRIATILLEQEKNEEGRKRVESNFLNALNTKNDYILAETYSILGRAQKKVGDLQAAETNLLKSFNLYQKLTAKGKGYIDLCTYLSTLYELKKDYKTSLSYYKAGINQEHKTSGKQNILYVSNLITKYDFQAKQIKIRQLEEKTRKQDFQTSRTRNILIITLVSLAFLSVALYSIYRQRLLNNETKLLNLEQQALQAQMNPHFIFNALNSIKLYIINNEQRQAVYYLNKFAKLVRNILVTSKKKEVNLQEELDTMELYVSIENIRFNNVIEYKTIIEEESLKLDTIKIPPLLLQPFLENAIWHGLSSKKGEDKKVTLTVSKLSSELIEIAIEDNGVGRDKAMAIKKNKSLKRESVGVDLTEERLKTFAKYFTTQSYVEYIDLKNNKGNPLGTKVILGIPII